MPYTSREGLITENDNCSERLSAGIKQNMIRGNSSMTSSILKHFSRPPPPMSSFYIFVH